MAVFAVTGKLGGGKSLMSVQKIQDYLNEGRTVATNLDLNLKYLLHPKAKKVKCFRIPDKPTSTDLLCIGKGNFSLDESRNGLLVLDECGIWFNTRNWNTSGRQDIINFLLMARKLGWDVFIIVQNISLLDKQARDAIIEFLVVCRRIDKLSIPFVSILFKMVTGKKLPLPQIHVALVTMGSQQYAPKSDTWSSYGTRLYSAYNTRQIFLDDCSGDAPYCYLPPIYFYKKPNLTLRQKMRLTKIYLKKFRRIPLIAMGVLLGYLLTFFYSLGNYMEDLTAGSVLSDTAEYADYRIVSYSKLPNQPQFYIISDGQTSVTTSELINSKFHVYSKNECSFILTNFSDVSPLNVRCADEKE